MPFRTVTYKHYLHLKTGLLFSIVLPILNVINNSPQRVDDDWRRIVGNVVFTFLFLLSSWIINARMYHKTITEKQAISWKRMAGMVVVNALFLCLFVLFVLLLSNNFQLNFTQPNRNFFLIAFRGFLSIALIYLIQYTLFSNQRAQDVQLQNQRLKTENLRAQLELLRQQVNPHFLFNSLSTLRSMIHSGNSRSETFVLKLSEVYRHLLSKQEKDLVSLQEELDFLDDYCYMLFTRFDNRLTVKVEIDEALLTKKIPTFSLQILLENCVKHNIISEEKPLHIKLFNSGTNHLIMENNRQPKLNPDRSSGYGLNNLKQRYSLYNEPEAVEIFQDASVFRVKINLLSV